MVDFPGQPGTDAPSSYWVTNWRGKLVRKSCNREDTPDTYIVTYAIQYAVIHAKAGCSGRSKSEAVKQLRCVDLDRMIGVVRVVMPIALFDPAEPKGNRFT